MRAELLSRLIIDLLRGICWYPDKSLASFNNDNQKGVYRIQFTPAPEDFYLVMGSACSQIQGIQYVAKLIAKHYGYSVMVSVMETHTEEQRRKVEHDFKPNHKFDPDDIVRILNNLIASALSREVRIRIRKSPESLTLLVEADESEEHVIDALRDAAQAYGYRNGCMIKLRRHVEEVVAK